MTTGIYILKFEGTDKVYIGQAHNIELRYSEHCNTLKQGLGSKKLQLAFDTYGKPELVILLDCNISELDEAEIEAISIYNSYDNGFNSNSGGAIPRMGASKYSKEDILQVFCLLCKTSPVLTYAEISTSTGVSISTISSVANAKTHLWLKEEYPTEFSIMKSISESNRKSSYNTTGILLQIVSPEGVLHYVDNISKFADTHGLSRSKLSSVLSGSRNMHKGWHLEKFDPKEYYPKLVSPTGVEYSVIYGKAAEFAREHKLDPGSLAHVFSGKQKTHRGWKLLIK